MHSKLHHVTPHASFDAESNIAKSLNELGTQNGKTHIIKLLRNLDEENFTLVNWHYPHPISWSFRERERERERETEEASNTNLGPASLCRVVGASVGRRKAEDAGHVESTRGGYSAEPKKTRLFSFQWLGGRSRYSGIYKFTKCNFLSSFSQSVPHCM